MKPRERMAALDRSITAETVPAERDMLRAFKSYMMSRGWIVFRRHVGQFRVGDRKVVVEQRGASDLYGILTGPLAGVHFECEVKRPGAWPTPYQVAWLRVMNRAGARAFWCDRPSRLVTIVDAIEAGARPYVDENGDLYIDR